MDDSVLYGRFYSWQTLSQITMTQKNHPGYPLPDGELGEDEIVCQLVYLPDRPEYWQALLAAIHYFSTWRAWERDEDKRGKDAASNWREAFEFTIGCWRMTCLEDLTNSVDDILELLQTRKDCCDDNITYIPVDSVETDIIPYEGEPPEFYGETAVEDWDEWLEYLCYQAHKYVDYLAHVGDNLLQSIITNSVIIGLIAGGLSLLAASGIGLPIAFTVAAAVTTGIILSGTLLTFADTEDDIEDARADIVCAIMEGTSLAIAVENALSSNAAWDLFYQFIQYDDAVAIMYEGGYEGEYFEPIKRMDCACCMHMRSTHSSGVVNYATEDGASVTITARESGSQEGNASITLRFNSTPAGWCGPMKKILTATTSDAIKMTHIMAYDQDDILLDEWMVGSPACNTNINVLNNQEAAYIYLQRKEVAQGGCYVDPFTVTFTYEDFVP